MVALNCFLPSYSPLQIYLHSQVKWPHTLQLVEQVLALVHVHEEVGCGSLSWNRLPVNPVCSVMPLYHQSLGVVVSLTVVDLVLSNDLVLPSTEKLLPMEWLHDLACCTG